MKDFFPRLGMKKLPSLLKVYEVKLLNSWYIVTYAFSYQKLKIVR